MCVFPSCLPSVRSPLRPLALYSAETRCLGGRTGKRACVRAVCWASGERAARGCCQTAARRRTEGLFSAPRLALCVAARGCFEELSVRCERKCGSVNVRFSVWMLAPSLVLLSGAVFTCCRLVVEFVCARLPDSIGTRRFDLFHAARASRDLEVSAFLNPENLKYDRANSTLKKIMSTPCQSIFRPALKIEFGCIW